MDDDLRAIADRSSSVWTRDCVAHLAWSQEGEPPRYQSHRLNLPYESLHSLNGRHLINQPNHNESWYCA